MYYYITVDILTSQLLLCLCVNGDAKILKFRHFPPLQFQTAIEGAIRSGVAIVSMTFEMLSNRTAFEDEVVKLIITREFPKLDQYTI